MRRDGGSVLPAHANTGPKWPIRGRFGNKTARALISMMARSTTRSNQKPDTLMQDRTSARSTKPSCNARPDHTLGQNRYPSPALACQPSPAADIDRPERLGQVRISKRLYELDPWDSSGDRADSAPDRQPTTTTICVALDSLRRCRIGVTCCVARLV